MQGIRDYLSLATKLFKETDIIYELKALHEAEHRLSFAINRPATKEFKDTAAVIFDLLLQQATTGTNDAFLARFNKLNNKLENCLSVRLALEEPRATIHALGNIPPVSQRRIIRRMNLEKQEDTDSQIIRGLSLVTGDRWQLAWVLTMLAEKINPDDPLSTLEDLQNAFNAGKAYTWPDERWKSFLESCWGDT